MLNQFLYFDKFLKKNIFGSFSCENLWKYMNFHENECILMDFLIRTLWRKILAADTLTTGQFAPLGGLPSRAPQSRLYKGGFWIHDASWVHWFLDRTFSKKVSQISGTQLLVPSFAKRLKRWTSFWTLFQKTDLYRVSWPTQMPSRKNPGFSPHPNKQTHKQT